MELNSLLNEYYFPYLYLDRFYELKKLADYFDIDYETSLISAITCMWIAQTDGIIDHYYSNTYIGNKAEEDKFNAEEAQREASALVREAYIDSLVNVTTGLDGASKLLNRKNALNILRKEYSTMNDKWDKCEESIDNMEMYSE